MSRPKRPTSEMLDAEALEQRRAEIRRIAELILPLRLTQNAPVDAAERSMTDARMVVAMWDEMEAATEAD